MNSVIQRRLEPWLVHGLDFRQIGAGPYTRQNLFVSELIKCYQELVFGMIEPTLLLMSNGRKSELWMKIVHKTHQTVHFGETEREVYRFYNADVVAFDNCGDDVIFLLNEKHPADPRFNRAWWIQEPVKVNGGDTDKL